MYESLYNLLQESIYGSLPLTSDMTLTLTIASTIGSLMLVAIPFFVVYRVLRFICG